MRDSASRAEIAALTLGSNVMPDQEAKTDKQSLDLLRQRLGTSR